jgi:ligand-binding sensor protein
VQVGVCIRGQIVVDGKVDTLNIDTTSENISSDTDTLVEFLELFVAFDTIYS